MMGHGDTIEEAFASVKWEIEVVTLVLVSCIGVAESRLHMTCALRVHVKAACESHAAFLLATSNASGPRIDEAYALQAHLCDPDFPEPHHRFHSMEEYFEAFGADAEDRQGWSKSKFVNCLWTPVPTCRSPPPWRSEDHIRFHAQRARP